MTKPDNERPIVEVQIRDLDKIRERTPLRIEPRHIVRTILIVLLLIAFSFVGGYFLGSGMFASKGPKRLLPVVSPNTQQWQPIPGEELLGIGSDEPDFEEKPVIQSVTGSVNPVNEPEKEEPVGENLDTPEEVETEVAGIEQQTEPEAPVQPELVAHATTPDLEAATPAPVFESAAPEAVLSEPEPEPSPEPRSLQLSTQYNERRPWEPFEQAIGIPEFLPALLFSNPNATCTTIDLNDSECQSAFEPEPEPEVEVEPASEPEEEPEEEPASGPELEPEEEPASGPELEPEEEPVLGPEPEVDSEAQPKIEAEPASEHESEPVPAPVPAPAPDPAPTPDPAPATKNYHVQIRAYQDEAAASDYANSLQQAGYPVKVINFVDAKGRQWFRIRVTGFKSKTAAKEFSKDFNLRNNEQSVVVEVQ